MSQLSEIPASAYTPEMETLGALPDIPTFDGEPVPVNLGKARSGGSATDASAFYDLLDPSYASSGRCCWIRGLCRMIASHPASFPARYVELENGRLRRHQSRQSSAVSRLQAEVERLRTKLEVEGIPLDSSDEDVDGSSSDEAPPSPSPSAAAGPSRRRR
ncbi:hypothetical protein JCGZ_26540 [Jatropha curcas]|uniref:Uncharacterized protein n=1 Tax=Jatropha curcas TaxID=180498 RepID=A0A067JL73_JATCU|nr:hypothetical protein JCGZ_26540 [Jatropha curcas]